MQQFFFNNSLFPYALFFFSIQVLVSNFIYWTKKYITHVLKNFLNYCLFWKLEFYKNYNKEHNIYFLRRNNCIHRLSLITTLTQKIFKVTSLISTNNSNEEWLSARNLLRPQQ